MIFPAPVRLAFLVIMLGVLFGPSLLAHIHNGMNPYIINDDARPQIPPFFHFEPGNNRAPDYADRYYLGALYPPGYNALYKTLVQIIPAKSLSKLLLYVLYGIMICALVGASWKLGGATTALATCLLVLSSPIFFDRMAGGLPRSFGYPLLAMALWALTSGRVWWLAGVTVLGSLFYPVSSVIAGLSLAVWLLVIPTAHRGKVAAWPLVKRLLVLAVTASLCASFTIPQLLEESQYGERVPGDDPVNFPQTQPGGRVIGPEQEGAHSNIVREVLYKSFATVAGRGDPFIPIIKTWMFHKAAIYIGVFVIIACIIFPGCLVMVWRQKYAPAIRVMAFPLSVLVAHSASVIFSPHLYFPDRYMLYTIPLLFTLLLPVSAGALAMKLPLPAAGLRWARWGAVLGIVAVILLGFGGKINPRQGYTVNTSSGAEIYTFIETLPEDSLLAGWPRGFMDNITYMTGRDVLVTYETHQVLHINYMQTLGQRVKAVMDAYYATSLEDVLKLRDEMKVDYLIVNLQHFTMMPRYFQPYDDYLKQKLLAIMERKQPFILPTLKDQTIFAKDNLFIINLHELQDKSTLPAQEEM